MNERYITIIRHFSKYEGKPLYQVFEIFETNKDKYYRVKRKEQFVSEVEIMHLKRCIYTYYDNKGVIDYVKDFLSYINKL